MKNVCFGKFHFLAAMRYHPRVAIPCDRLLTHSSYFRFDSLIIPSAEFRYAEEGRQWKMIDWNSERWWCSDVSTLTSLVVAHFAPNVFSRERFSDSFWGRCIIIIITGELWRERRVLARKGTFIERSWMRAYSGSDLIFVTSMLSCANEFSASSRDRFDP